MINPWPQLPSSAPRVMQSDLTVVEAFNHRFLASPNYTLQTHLFPEPFIGDPRSPVYVLGLNPGYSPDDDDWHADPQFSEAIRTNLNHLPSSYPFYFLDPRFTDSPGAGWWQRKCRWLIEMSSPQFIAERIFCVELFPYHSKNYKPVPKGISANSLVPSCDYSTFLVRTAMKEKKAVVVMRAFRPWCKLIPELETYSNLFRLKSPQNVSLSPNNVVGYDKLISEINGTS